MKINRWDYSFDNSLPKVVELFRVENFLTTLGLTYLIFSIYIESIKYSYGLLLTYSY